MGPSLFYNQPRRGRLWVVAVCMAILFVFSVYHVYQIPLGGSVSDRIFPEDEHINHPQPIQQGKGSYFQEIVLDMTGREPRPETSHHSSNNTPPTHSVSEPATTTPAAVGRQTVATSPPTPTCTPFEQYIGSKPGPPSAGKRQFPYVRPPPECRTFKLPALEKLIGRMKGVIKDPDLFRLFENSYPNTLDTMVKWRGYANRTDEATGESFVTDEELTYVITGDIDAMWLRDSASQIYSYLPLLEASTAPDSLASLWRGLINAHARYIKIAPYCHSFQPPPESGIPPTPNAAYGQNHPNPAYDPLQVFDCKWELDSLASFLQISAAYHAATGDTAFFGRHGWVDAVRAAVDAAGAMRRGTYDGDGRVLPSAWTFTGWTDRGSETLTNNGLGNPTRENGMVRTAFRPSDDATIYQLLVPSNMMWAAYLEDASGIMARLAAHHHPDARNLTAEMRAQAAGIRRGIDEDAVVPWRRRGEDIFAYEVDGFGGVGLMDDANVPSLLAMPLWNYSRPTTTSSSSSRHDKTTTTTKRDYDAIYRATRAFILSDANPYYARGPALSAVGGPHVGPGKAWPMAALVAGLTAYEPASGLAGAALEAEVARQLAMVLDSTAGAGLVHETVDSWRGADWTRPWFGWANGLLGQLLLRIEREEARGGVKAADGLLGRSWQ